MTKRTSRRHTDEFKREAVRLANESGKPKSAIARELDISVSLLYGWIEKSASSKNKLGSAIAPQNEDELKKLKAELKQVKIENEILKKATAYFARDQL